LKNLTMAVLFFFFWEFRRIDKIAFLHVYSFSVQTWWIYGLWPWRHSENRPSLPLTEYTLSPIKQFLNFQAIWFWPLLKDDFDVQKVCHAGRLDHQPHHETGIPLSSWNCWISTIKRYSEVPCQI
jgi:hypothetical protein